MTAEETEEMREELLYLGGTDSSMPLHCACCGTPYEDDAPIVLLKALLGTLSPFSVAAVHGHLFSHGLNWLSHPVTSLDRAALSGLGDFLKIAQLDLKAVAGDNQ